MRLWAELSDKSSAGGVTRWRILCWFAPAGDLTHCSSNGKDGNIFFTLLLPLQLLETLANVQQTAAKQCAPTCQEQQQIPDSSVL